MLTPYQQLAQVRTVTGRIIQLEMLDEVKACDIQPDMVEVWIRTADTVVSGQTIRVRRYGMKVVRTSRTAAGRWVYDPPEVIWFEPGDEVIIRSEPPHTSSEEKLEWERLCHRPGNRAWPVDSYARTQQGY